MLAYNNRQFEVHIKGLDEKYKAIEKDIGHLVERVANVECANDNLDNRIKFNLETNFNTNAKMEDKI